ncbi:hypothetical protein [Borreliella valaisiana]|uniref:hypothetical protein n=1 Tax=Borreliella valaisiana TaxID=62088 RepID=UPI002ED28307|nr:hypothetical protein KJD09_05920 [Borreliella valaisiana]
MLINKFKGFEKIIEKYKPMFLSTLIDDFSIKLNQVIDNESNARHSDDSLIILIK